jgi:AraC family transcriptional regulator
MLLLRQFPDPKRLEPLARNEAYRKSFYARWGVENCIVLARSRRVEYPLFEQRLSIKVASGGRERYLLTGPNRQIDVDEDNYLIVNDGRTYGSVIAAEREVESFSVFFKPGFPAEVRDAMNTPITRALDGGLAGTTEPEFQEFLQPHDALITPVLGYIRHHIRLGIEDAGWYEEQLYFLLERMLRHRDQERRRVAELPAMRRATKMEIFRRVMLAASHIQSHFDRDLDLDTLAAEACLSKFHFLRLFRDVMGVTPYAYLLRKRTHVAKRLIATTGRTFDEIALQVGFATRSSLFRQMRRWMACRPHELRAGSHRWRAPPASGTPQARFRRRSR